MKASWKLVHIRTWHLILQRCSRILCSLFAGVVLAKMLLGEVVQETMIQKEKTHVSYRRTITTPSTGANWDIIWKESDVLAEHQINTTHLMSRSGKRHLKHKGIFSHVFYLYNVWYYYGVSMVYPLWHDKFFTPPSKQYSHPLKEHIQHGLYYIAMIKTIFRRCTSFKIHTFFPVGCVT